MNKYFGIIGFATTSESSTQPGVWEETIIEKEYFGDISRSSRRLQGSDKINSDVVFSKTISIVSDPYAFNHYGDIRYITLNGFKWKVDTVDVQYPRLILTTGELYNA